MVYGGSSHCFDWGVWRYAPLEDVVANMHTPLTSCSVPVPHELLSHTWAWRRPGQGVRSSSELQAAGRGGNLKAIVGAGPGTKGWDAKHPGQTRGVALVILQSSFSILCASYGEQLAMQAFSSLEGKLNYGIGVK